jgi:hypothetical protein
LGNFKAGPQEILPFITDNNGMGIKLRPNRLGFVTWNKERVNGHYMLNVYRTDAALSQTITHTIPYGSDTAYGQDWVYPMGDDGYLFLGTPYNLPTPPPDNRLFTYLARYDANGNKMWGGRTYNTRTNIAALSDGGMLMFTDSDTLFDSKGYLIKGATKESFCRIRADSSVIWTAGFSNQKYVAAYSLSFDNRGSAIKYGQKGDPTLGYSPYSGPWVGFFSNFGTPIDPTAVRGPRARPARLEAVLYPNPAQGFVQLQIEKAMPFRIVTVTGAVVQEGVASPKIPIDIAALPPTLYQLILNDGQQKVVKRFVKN